MTLQAISIRQPWAWLVVNGFKDVENRGWATSHRGPIQIHAGLTFDTDCDLKWCNRILARDHGVVMPDRIDDYPRGGIVGRVDIVACAKRDEAIEGWSRAFINDSDWFTGPVGWALANAVARPLKRCRGKQGIFIPDFTPPPTPARRGRRR